MTRATKRHGRRSARRTAPPPVTGADLVALATGHVGDPYVFGAFVAKDNPNWHGPWDCAEFASWCVYQTAHKLYGCADDSGDPSEADAYTGYWARDAKELGKRITVNVAARTPGAAVLRVPVPGQVIGHVVFSDGQGGTVEAHSAKRGVIRHTLDGRRWDMGILVPGIAYAKEPEPHVVTAPAFLYRLTAPKMKGEAVRRIQQALAAQGLDPGPLDGVYGGQTLAAVRAFQLREGLLPDGEVGPETAAALGVAL